MFRTISSYLFTTALIILPFYGHFTTIPTRKIVGATKGESKLCPDQCYCLNNDSRSLDVLCDRGGLNDKTLHKLLQQIAKRTTSIEIRAPPWNSNQFTLTQDLVTFKNLKRLILANSGLPSLGKRSLEALKNLHNLELPFNNIDTLSPDTFVNLDSLKVLDLSFNSLRRHTLPTGTFVHLKNLTILNLSHNNLKIFANNLFSGLTKLKTLDISYNLFNKENDFALLRDLPDLESLSLRGCQISSFSTSAFSFNRNLKVLNLGGNNLNDYHALKSILENILQIEDLDISYNNIQVIPDNFFANLAKLKSLNLAGNLHIIRSSNILANFEAFFRPQIFGTAIKLNKLNLSNSNILDFDSSYYLAQFNDSLTSLDLSHNPLGHISPNQTAVLASLRSLYLSNIKLNQLPIEYPKEYANIEYLDVSHNEIKFVPVEFLRYLRSIKFLDLAFNKLTNLPYYFKNFMDKQILNSTSLFNLLDNKTSKQPILIKFDQNPWHCDCQTLGLLREYLLAPEMGPVYRKINSENVSCFTPVHYQQKPVVLLDGPVECSAAYFRSTSNLHEQASFSLLLGGSCGAVLIVGLVAALIYSLFCAPGATYHTNEEKVNLSVSSYSAGGPGGGGLSPGSSDDPTSDCTSERSRRSDTMTQNACDPLCQ